MFKKEKAEIMLFKEYIEHLINTTEVNDNTDADCFVRKLSLTEIECFKSKNSKEFYLKRILKIQVTLLR